MALEDTMRSLREFDLGDLDLGMEDVKAYLRLKGRKPERLERFLKFKGAQHQTRLRILDHLMEVKAPSFKRACLRARTVISANYWRRASKEVQALCRSNPGKAEVWILRAKLQLEWGSPYYSLRNAARDSQRAISIAPKSAEGHYHLGRALGRAGLAKPALKALQRVDALEPDFHALGYELADAYCNAGRHAEGEAYATKWLRRHPDDGYALSIRTRARRKLGKLEQAWKDQTRAIKLTRNPGLHLERAKIRRAQGRLAEALAEVELSIKHPGVPTWRVALKIHLLLDLKRPQETLPLYQALLKYHAGQPRRLWPVKVQAAFAEFEARLKSAGVLPQAGPSPPR